MAQAICRTCDVGQLERMKLHRLSGPAVIIGYLLLIPSILAILLMLAFLVFSIWGYSLNDEPILPDETREELRAAGVPSRMIEALDRGEEIPEEEVQALTPEQRAQVEPVNRFVGSFGATTGMMATCGTGLSITGIVIFFISGLLGWILVMKRTVLVCNSCRATVDAA